MAAIEATTKNTQKTGSFKIACKTLLLETESVSPLRLEGSTRIKILDINDNHSKTTAVDSDPNLSLTKSGATHSKAR
jgi:hypothetical protein